MRARAAFWVVMGLLATAELAWGQQPWDGGNQPPQGRQGPGIGPAGPDQPVVPLAPFFQLRLQPPGAQQPAAVQSPRVPFVLTPFEEAQLDRVLQFWEQQSSKVKTFSCQFTQLTYDAVFGDGKRPRFIDRGEIRYAAPDKGKFVVRGDRPEQCICDGKSVCQYDYANKQVIEYKLPPELQGQAIANGPMPFLFGAKAAQLKQRYFLRITTPGGVQGQVWIEAWPRFQSDAANFYTSEIILNAADMQPIAVQVVAPNRLDHKTYKFEKVAVNKSDFLNGVFGSDEFRASTPYNWKRDVRESPRGPSGAASGAASRPAVGGNFGPR